MEPKSATTHGYCLQSEVMSEDAQEQAVSFCTRYNAAMQKLTPPAYPTCNFRPTLVELSDIPDNQACKERTLKFIKDNQQRYTTLRFATLPGKLIVDERPPAFRSPWWLKLLLCLVVAVLALAHFVAFDRLTFL